MRDVPFAPGYKVDEQGGVWRGGVRQTPRLDAQGMPRVYFRRESGYNTVRLLARVVGEVYSPGYRRTYPPVFKDGDPTNCAVTNLEWVPTYPFPDRLLPADLTASGIAPREIAGSDGYAVHAEGYISRRGVPCWPYVDPSGVLRLGVKMKSHYDGVSVGRVVGQHFDPNYRPELLLAHKDGDRLNCALSNLMWVDHHHYLVGAPKTRRRTTKLTDALVKRLRSGDLSVQEAVKLTGAAGPTISAAKRGRTWRHLTI